MPADTPRQLSFDLSPPLPGLTALWTADDIWAALDPAVVTQFREDNRVERKRVEVNAKELAAYAAMWGNTQPHGGIVLIGVSNEGEITGCKHSPTSHINDLEGVRRFVPDARVEFKRVGVINVDGAEDFVMAMRAYYRSDKLVEHTDGSAYVREGDQKRRLTETEKREIRLGKGEVECELEPIALAFPADFDQHLLAEYRREFIEKRRLPASRSLEDVLHLSKFGKTVDGRFQPNLACALLFANDPRAVVPGAFIRIIRYDGAEEQFGQSLNVVADRLIEGPLAIQIRDAEQFILSQMRSFTRLGTDGRFVTRPEYPQEVWLEAVVNAVVHRSYNLRNMNIFVKMFEDRLIVDSPGTFMPPTTAATVYEAHNPRNPHTMWGLYYFDYVQCAFEGTRRMLHGMRAASLPDPVFVQKTAGVFQVSVTLQNDREHRKAFVRAEAHGVMDPALMATLSDGQRLIINYLVERGTLNVTEAALLLNTSWRSAKDMLSDLENKKVVLRTAGKERDKMRRYYIRPQVRSGSDAR